MKALLIPPCNALTDEITLHLKCMGNDFSSNTVVFPGKRPSHFLRKALAARLRRGFVPPVIFSMDEFVDSFYENKIHDRKIEAIDAVALLYNIHCKASGRLGKDGFITPDSFMPVGMKIYSDIEELLIEDVSPHSIRDIGPESSAVPEQTMERLHSLSFYYEEFYRAVKNHGFSTRSQRYRMLADEINCSEDKRQRQVIFAGFFALTKSEKTIFRKLCSADNVLFVFQDGAGIQEKLVELGIKPEQTKAQNYQEPEIRFYTSPDGHGQIFALAGVLKDMAGEGLADNIPDTDTVIVLPASEMLFPLVRQAMPFIDEGSFNISMGYPLHRTPVFSFINNLMELVTSMDGDRYYIPDYLNFVLHPYTKNIYYRDSAEITRIMFHAIEEELLKRRTITFVSLAELENNKELFNAIAERLGKDKEQDVPGLIRKHFRDIHSNTAEKFVSFENVGDFAAKCIELLTYISGSSTARLHPLFHPFTRSFIRSLELLRHSLMKEIAFTEKNSYFIFLRRYIMTCHSPFEGTPLRGLQVLGLLETRNIRFRKVFVMNTNEDILPDTRKEDTLLPLRAREMLGLPTYADKERLAAYYFDVLVNGADIVHLFFTENDTMERSRFVERLLWQRQKRNKETDPRKYIKAVQYKVRLSSSLPAEIKKTAGVVSFLKDFQYSATALDKYLKCPLQFYYAYVLNLGPKEDISGDIERTDIGKLVHRALSLYFSKRKGRRLKESDISHVEMGLLADDLFRREYGENLSGAAYLMKRQIKNRLDAFLKHYYIPVLREDAVTILECEYPVEMRIDSFNLKGRIDHIEQRGDMTFIIDYKTGANRKYLDIRPSGLDINDRETWSRAIGSLQLPFYLMLYAEETGAALKDLKAFFLMLGQAFISKDMELPLSDNKDAEDLYTLLKSVILRLLKEIIDADSPFAASTDMKKNCPGCDFRNICGTQWIC